MYTVYFKADHDNNSVSIDTKSRAKLVAWVAKADLHVTGIFENTTPVTEAVRNELKRNYKGVLSSGARAFVFPMNLQ